MLWWVEFKFLMIHQLNWALPEGWLWVSELGRVQYLCDLWGWLGLLIDCAGSLGWAALRSPMQLVGMHSWSILDMFFYNQYILTLSIFISIFEIFWKWYLHSLVWRDGAMHQHAAVWAYKGSIITWFSFFLRSVTQQGYRERSQGHKYMTPADVSRKVFS